MNRIATILLTLSILYSHHAFSQYFQSTNYKEGSGLPSSETYMVHQDAKGFLWIATDNGVVKYDGHEFVTYTTKDGLTDNTVFGFFEDHKGRIWFRTYNGALCYYENDSIKVYKYNAELKTFMKQAILSKIRYDSLGELYFSTLFETMTGKVDSVGRVITTSFHEDDWDFLSFVGDKMLYGSLPPRTIESVRIDGKEFPIELDDKRNQNNWLIASVEWRGKLYFTIYKNIFEYDEQNGTVKKVFTSEKSFICLYVDHQDRLWAGSYNNGVNIFKDQSFKDPSTLANLSTISVSSVMEDYEDGMWISTLDQGVFYFPNLTLEHFSLPDIKRISSVVFGNKEVFLGNYGGQVYRVTDKGTVNLVNPGVAPVSLLFLDNNKNLWVSDGAGTQILQTGATVGTDVDKRGIVYKTLIQVGDSIIGCTSMGFDILSLEGKTLKKVQSRKRPIAMTIVNNEIYLGGLNGLDRFETDIKKVEGTKIIDHRTASLINLDNQFLAVGTVGRGLFIYDTKKQELLPIPIADVSSVYSMVDDWENRRLWIGTEKGLFQLELTSDGSNVVLDHFSKADGLSSTKINSVGRIGENIWAISDLGISKVPQNHFSERNFVPKFYINRILFRNHSIATNPSLVTTTEEDMVLDIRAITFKGQPTMFRYRLNEDQPWNMVTGGSIFLTDLRPDEYHMQIQASSGNRDWTKGLSLKIDIMAKWWETWPFRIVVVVAIMLLGYLAYWLRINAIRRQQKYLELINLHQQKLIDSEIRTQERERKRIAGDLHDGIGTSLSSIKLQIADAMTEETPDQTRAREINDNLTDVIDEIKRIVYDLHPPGLERYGLHSGLKGLADRINKASEINVIFDYYGQRDVMQPVSITIFRIIQELINNTLKHARASEIRIHINEFDDEINIMYEDNGIGMIGSRFTGLGLHSIESRVRSLNGRMSWESNHKGTFYNFDIPF